MTTKIQADYDELGDIASRFASEADCVEQLTHAIARMVDELSGGGWIGRGADAFYDEMYNEVLPRLRRLVNALQDAGNATTRVSQTMQDAEQSASALFGSAGGGGYVRTAGANMGKFNQDAANKFNQDAANKFNQDAANKFNQDAANKFNQESGGKFTGG